MQAPFINLEYFFQKILDFFQGGGQTGWSDFWDKLATAQLIFSIIALILFVLAVLVLIQIWELQKHVKEHMYHAVLAAQQKAHIKGRHYNPRWQAVLEYLSSENEGDWRLAILEADSILADYFETLSYEGDDLGEKMKQVDPNDVPTIDHVWEAHKVRNRIAHEGTDYPVSQQEAIRVTKMYEDFFKGVGYFEE